jgi:Arc/MetJ family transcription regulator
MPIQAKTRKMRRSFTLTPEVVAFISDTRERRGVRTDSEAVELLLREAMPEAGPQDIDAAYKEYYDSASDEVLAEQREWAR